MTISQKRDTIRTQIRQILYQWDIFYSRINDVKDSENRTLTFYIYLGCKYDSQEVEIALEEICEEWDMASWWDEDENNIYVLQCEY